MTVEETKADDGAAPAPAPAADVSAPEADAAEAAPATETPAVADGGAAESGEPAAPEEPAPPRNEKLKWYVVHTYSGFEARAEKGLIERIKMAGLEAFFGEILVPVENVQELVRGNKRTSKRKFFPGYMFVEMELNDQTWHCVKQTPKITGFVGNARNPVPVRQAEVERLTKQIDEGMTAVKPKVAFEEGEHVRVTDGPFASFNGVVQEVKPDKQKVKVLVSIFGRPTPVELEYVQVEKTSA